jgi:TRAP-type mannitol/chloroaromatic compound transport system substrate-binding protein
MNVHELAVEYNGLMDEYNVLMDQYNEICQSLKDATEIILEQKANLEIAKEIVENYEAYFKKKSNKK